MADSPRIEDLRRRIQKDPASIAFAQLAEEYRRAGQYAEAIDVCRAGLALHPGYLSARVTLAGRSSSSERTPRPSANWSWWSRALQKISPPFAASRTFIAGAAHLPKRSRSTGPR